MLTLRNCLGVNGGSSTELTQRVLLAAAAPSAPRGKQDFLVTNLHHRKKIINDALTQAGATKGEKMFILATGFTESHDLIGHENGRNSSYGNFNMNIDMLKDLGLSTAQINNMNKAGQLGNNAKIMLQALRKYKDKDPAYDALVKQGKKPNWVKRKGYDFFIGWHRGGVSGKNNSDWDNGRYRHDAPFIRDFRTQLYRRTNRISGIASAYTDDVRWAASFS